MLAPKHVLAALPETGTTTSPATAGFELPMRDDGILVINYSGETFRLRLAITAMQSLRASARRIQRVI